LLPCPCDPPAAIMRPWVCPSPDTSLAGTPASGRLVAREAELGVIEQLVRREDHRATALVLSGEPGVGKTSLWETGVALGAEHLPYADGTFDVVVSAIGVMFSADHQQAADELVRVCRPGGRIAIASWTPDGFVGGMLAAVGRHVSPPPGAQRPTRWGEEELVAELLGPEVVDVRSVTATVTQRFADAEAFADLFVEYYGPTYSAARRLPAEGRAALRNDLVALAGTFDRTSGPGVALDWEYRVVSATRGGSTRPVPPADSRH
jgi:SAM-dependent methyltransferase